VTQFLITAAVSGLIFGLLGLGLNVQWGFGGMVNFGVVGFFSLGAYGTALAAVAPPGGGSGRRDSFLFGLELPFFVALAFGTLLAAAVAVLLAALVLRAKLSDDYLGVVTLAFSQILWLTTSTQKEVVNGFNGIRNIPSPVDVDAQNYDEQYMLFAAAVAVAAGLLVWGIWRSPFGRVLRVVREDSEIGEAFGYNARRHRVAAFAIGAAVAGLAGGLWAGFLGSITPNAFLIEVTLLALSAVVIGGTGNILGTYLGSFLVVGVIQQGSRFVPWPSAVEDYIPPLRLMLVGLLLMIVLRVRPEGVLPERLVKIRRPSGESPGRRPAEQTAVGSA